MCGGTASPCGQGESPAALAATADLAQKFYRDFTWFSRIANFSKYAMIGGTAERRSPCFSTACGKFRHDYPAKEGLSHAQAAAKIPVLGLSASVLLFPPWERALVSVDIRRPHLPPLDGHLPGPASGVEPGPHGHRRPAAPAGQAPLHGPAGRGLLHPHHCPRGVLQHVPQVLLLRGHGLRRGRVRLSGQLLSGDPEAGRPPGAFLPGAHGPGHPSGARGEGTAPLPAPGGLRPPGPGRPGDRRGVSGVLPGLGHHDLGHGLRPGQRV